MHWCSGRSAMVTGTGSTEITYLVIYQVFPGSSVGKNPSAKQETRETWVWSLGREDPLKKEMATHSSLLAWRTPAGYSQTYKEVDRTKGLNYHQGWAESELCNRLGHSAPKRWGWGWYSYCSTVTPVDPDGNTWVLNGVGAGFSIEHKQISWTQMDNKAKNIRGSNLFLWAGFSAARIELMLTWI